MRGVSELPAPLDFNGCDTKPGSIDPAEVLVNPGACRTFAASDLLRAAHERFFTTETGTLADALRGDVEFAVYCRALFHLKRGIGLDPRDALFNFDHSDETADVVAAGFERAIAFAYAQEAAS